MYTFDFTFLDAWSRKKITAPPYRKPGVSADVWINVYTPTDDLSRLKWPGEVKLILLEVARECRGGIYMTVWPKEVKLILLEVARECRGGIYLTVDELAPHGDESVEFLVNDELFYHAVDLIVPTRPDSSMGMRQGPSGPGPEPYAKNDDVTD